MAHEPQHKDKADQHEQEADQHQGGSAAALVAGFDQWVTKHTPSLGTKPGAGLLAIFNHVAAQLGVPPFEPKADPPKAEKANDKPAA
jgi:hypothetical protein